MIPLALGMLAFVLFSLHPECVTVRVVACGSSHPITATVTLSSVTLCADVRVTPHSEHRWLTVVWDYAPDSFTGLAESGDQGGGTDLALTPPTDDVQGDTNGRGALGSSRQTLNGDREPLRPRPNGFRMEGLSGGVYEVVATVYADAGRTRVHGRDVTRVSIR